MSAFMLSVITLLLFNKSSASNSSKSDDIQCNGHAYIRDMSNCSWFYRCDISGRSQHLQCLPGLLFNEWINDCDHAYNVAECAEYPFLCRYFAMCWPPITAKANSSQTLQTNSSKLIISS